MFMGFFLTCLFTSSLQGRVYDQDSSGGGICRSYNDPHMQTFDGIYWENQRVGEFVMYKHKTKSISVSFASSTNEEIGVREQLNPGLTERFGPFILELYLSSILSLNLILY